jgi:hypothetical protein
MEEIPLTAKQEAETERILDVRNGTAAAEHRQVSRLLASKSNHELFGATAFRI